LPLGPFPLFRQALSARLVIAVVALALAVRAFAADQRFAFAVPEEAGKISLGVYDAGGKLVRTLFAAADDGAFTVGLNGFIATWDGRDDAGTALPDGTYHIRGYLVPDAVTAEGEAFHGNDWVTDDTAPKVAAITGIGPQAGGEFYLTARLANSGEAGAVLRFREADGLTEVAPVPGRTWEAFGADRLVFADATRLSLLSLADPATAAGVERADLRAGTVGADRVYVLPAAGGDLGVYDFALAPQAETLVTPEGATGLDAGPEGLWAWSDRAVWIRRAGAFEPVPVENLPAGFSASAGPGATLWVAGRDATGLVARQFGADATLLRELRVDEPFDTVRVFASRTEEIFFLLLEAPGRQTVRGYRRAGQGPAAEGAEPVPVDWEVFLDRTIEASAHFGAKDGRFVADAGPDAPPNQARFRLKADPLTGKAGSVTVVARTFPDGLWLATKDGLRLKKLTDATQATRLMVLPVQSGGSLRVFAGDGVVVAEYLVRDVDDLLAIDVGGVELP
jgi:hypothetical protein